MAKPLYATISQNRSIFSVHYKRSGNIYHNVLTGYNIETFEDLPDKLPVIRYDLMTYERVLEVLKSKSILADREYLCDESGANKFFNQTVPINTAVYLVRLRTFDVPVQILSTVKFNFKLGD